MGGGWRFRWAACPFLDGEDSGARGGVTHRGRDGARAGEGGEGWWWASLSWRGGASESLGEHPRGRCVCGRLRGRSCGRPRGAGRWWGWGGSLAFLSSSWDEGPTAPPPSRRRGACCRGRKERGGRPSAAAAEKRGSVGAGRGGVSPVARAWRRRHRPLPAVVRQVTGTSFPPSSTPTPPPPKHGTAQRCRPVSAAPQPPGELSHPPQCSLQAVRACQVVYVCR